MSRRNALQAGRQGQAGRSRFSAKAKAATIAMINVQNSGIYSPEISFTAAPPVEAEFVACSREVRADGAALHAVSNRQTRETGLDRPSRRLVGSDGIMDILIYRYNSRPPLA